MLGANHHLAAIVAGEAAVVAVAEIHGSPGLLCSAVCILTSACAGYFPDLDTRESTISRRFPFLYLPVFLFRCLVGLVSLIPGPLQSRVKAFYHRTGHRGFSHYPFTWLMISGLLLASVLLFVSAPFRPVALWALVGMVTGVASHIIGDAFFGGVALLYPLSDRKIRFSPFKTGGRAEYVVSILLVIALISLFVCLDRLSSV